MSRTASLGFVLLLTVSLSACAAADSGQTLAETKSPVQLLRNEVAARLPSELVLAAENEDFSEACGDDESVRAWHSSVTLDINTSGEAEVDAAVDQLSASFEDDGWVSTPGNDRLEYKQAYFTGGVPGVQIQVSVPPRTGDAGEGEHDQLYINVFGACVQTDGPDSDEVTSLEGLS